LELETREGIAVPGISPVLLGVDSHLEPLLSLIKLGELLIPASQVEDAREVRWVQDQSLLVALQGQVALILLSQHRALEVPEV